MICDNHGRKMSKSLGNIIEPDYVINGISLKVSTYGLSLPLSGFYDFPKVFLPANNLERCFLSNFFTVFFFLFFFLIYFLNFYSQGLPFLHKFYKNIERYYNFNLIYLYEISGTEQNSRS